MRQGADDEQADAERSESFVHETYSYIIAVRKNHQSMTDDH